MSDNITFKNYNFKYTFNRTIIIITMCVTIKKKNSFNNQ